ncbi:MAG TPA: O-antigen ligase family protein [Burkholderiales bacterium]|nr:O-antigen ligase family protein [Burkholderiales bacterium]
MWIFLRERPRLPLKAPLAFWLVAASISLLWSAEISYSVSELRGDVVYGIATFYAFVVLTRNARDLRRWRRVTALSMGLAGLSAGVSYLVHGEWVPGFHNFIGEYCTFVVTGLPLVLTGYFAGTLRAPRQEQALTAAAIALGLCGALVAKSRAFWVILTAVGLMVASLQLTRRLTSRRKILASVAILVLLAAAALAYGTSQRGIPLDFFSERKAIYQFSVEQIARHPLAGSGYGREINRDAYRAQFPGKGFFHPHDVVFGYMEQMGLLGLAALIWLFAAFVRVFWRAWRSEQSDTAAVGLAGLMLVSAVAMKNIPDLFFVGHLLLLFCAHAGILVGYITARPVAIREGPPHPGSNGRS